MDASGEVPIYLYAYVLNTLFIRYGLSDFGQPGPFFLCTHRGGSCPSGGSMRWVVAVLR